MRILTLILIGVLYAQINPAVGGRVDFRGPTSTRLASTSFPTGGNRLGAKPVSPNSITTGRLNPDSRRILFAAIRQVESGGNDKAVGDKGKSKGPYQCGRAAWLDGCGYGHATWSYHDCVFSRWHTEQVMIWYWAKYGAKTDEQRARMWNGGPRGMHKAATLGYWAKVKRAMK